MITRHPIRQRFETALTRMAFHVIPRLPRSVVVRLARLAGPVGYWSSSKLRHIGLANLDLAFGATRTPQEKRAILRRAFSSFALVTLDAFWFSRDSVARINRLVSFAPEFDRLFQHKPHICITAHYGNWEVMGMAINTRGFQLHSVAKPLKNPAVDALFIEARRPTGQKIIRRQGAMRGLLKAVLAGEKVALVLDQNTRMAEGGRFFPFFGLPVLVSTAPAALAIKTRTDFFLGMMTPQADGSYRGEFGMEIPITPYLNQDLEVGAEALTRDVTRMLENFLREKPDHWLWMYKRWKYIPGDVDPSRYPFYARRSLANPQPNTPPQTQKNQTKPET